MKLYLRCRAIDACNGVMDEGICVAGPEGLG